MSLNQISDIGIMAEEPCSRAHSPPVDSIAPNMSASVVASGGSGTMSGHTDWMEIVQHIIHNLRNSEPPLISGLERSAFLSHLNDRNLWHLWGRQLTKGCTLEQQALSVKDFCEFEMWQLTQEARASIENFARASRASLSVPPAPPPLVDSNQWQPGSFQRLTNKLF